MKVAVRTMPRPARPAASLAFESLFTATVCCGCTSISSPSLRKTYPWLRATPSSGCALNLAGGRRRKKRTATNPPLLCLKQSRDGAGRCCVHTALAAKSLRTVELLTRARLPPRQNRFMTEPGQLSDFELLARARAWRREALQGVLHARGHAHEHEAEVRRRFGRATTISGPVEGATTRRPRRWPWRLWWFTKRN
jgi:hypothetical protein